MIELFVSKPTNNLSPKPHEQKKSKKKLDKNAEMCFSEILKKEIKKVLTKNS